jgi:hypothetical protein
MTSWLALWICSFRWRRVALASSIFCFIDFSLVLARHSLSSFCVACNWSSNSLSLCYSTLLAFKEFWSWGAVGARIHWSRRQIPSYNLFVMHLIYSIESQVITLVFVLDRHSVGAFGRTYMTMWRPLADEGSLAKAQSSPQGGTRENEANVIRGKDDELTHKPSRTIGGRAFAFHVQSSQEGWRAGLLVLQQAQH